MSVKSGRYVIINVKQKNSAHLPDDGDSETPISACDSQDIPHAQWDVARLDNGKYLIQNAKDIERYANAGYRAGEGETVKGWAKGQEWNIQETDDKGNYTIATTDSRLIWTLRDDQPRTPITLSDLYTDQRCWWIFKSLKVDGEPAHDKVDEEPPNEEAAPFLLLDIESSISGARDLRSALKSTAEALRKALETAQNMAKTNKEWEWPSKRLLFHVDTIENQNEKLEEDFKIDGVIPPPVPTVIRPLEAYASQLKSIYELLCDTTPIGSSEIASNAEREVTIIERIHNMEEIFDEYTNNLHDFATVQILAEVPQFIQAPRQDDTHPPGETSALRTLFNMAFHKPRKTPNAYGVQHGTCLEGTREKSQEAIRQWANNKSSKKPIFLLLDVAGSGKSTVAKHMAEEWTTEERLVARFFFSRDTESTMSTTSFCSTVADAFISLDRKFEAPVKVFRERPDFGLLSFKELFDGLVIGPLKTLRRDAILIIDALDECNNEGNSRDELLNAIQSQRSSKLRLRILATGRPELDIKQWAEASGVEHADFFQLEGGYKDVEIYIRHRLRHLRHNQDELFSIIRRADGAFIWARIACDLMANSANVKGVLGELGKEASLDHLYQVALEQSLPKDKWSLQAFYMVFQMILASKEPLSIEQLEQLSPVHDIVDQIVSRLGSLLRYDGRKDPIRFLHATFREFLTTRAKAGVYFVEPELGHHTLALRCLEIINQYPRLDLSTFYKLDRLAHGTYVYSSKSWVYHCMASYRKLGLNRQLLEFANSGLQTWAVFWDKIPGERLDTVSCLKDTLSLSRQKMSPEITEMMVDSSLEIIVRVSH